MNSGILTTTLPGHFPATRLRFPDNFALIISKQQPNSNRDELKYFCSLVLATHHINEVPGAVDVSNVNNLKKRVPLQLLKVSASSHFS
jgi:hypothetical protein